jgi:parallel beta-helix repeat protein
VVGRLWFTRQSHDSEVRGLALDGRNRDALPSPTVNGTGIRFVHNNVYNGHTNICFILGSEGFGRARGTVIRDNRIHDCGRLPAENHDHGIYVSLADRTTIVGNWIYDNADRGIQLYPDAQGTRIERNVIDGNGEGIIFSGSDGMASSNNVVQDNVIANSRIRADVESFWDNTSPGHGNVVQHNCIGSGGIRGIDRRSGGFDAHGNITARPRYADRAHGNLRVVGPRACVALLR